MRGLRGLVWVVWESGILKLSDPSLPSPQHSQIRPEEAQADAWFLGTIHFFGGLGL